MAYDEKYRKRAIEYKENNHTFKELKEAFRITSNTYYEWKKLMEETGSLKYNNAKTRRRKIDKEKLKQAIEEKPDAYLRELAELFDCTEQAIFYALKKMKITLKKRRLHILKNQK